MSKSPIKDNVITYGKVATNATKTKETAPKNFPIMNCLSEIDFVKINSSVPDFFSSAIIFIVIAGIKKNNVQDEIVKKVLRFACPTKKISFP